jgi:VWFA-related protein
MRSWNREIQATHEAADNHFAGKELLWWRATDVNSVVKSVKANRLKPTFAQRTAWLVGLLCFAAAAIAQHPASQEPQSGPPNPELTHRPPPKPRSLAPPEGSMKIDVVVKDASDKAVTGLQPWDFKISDNNQPRKILSFRAFSDNSVKPDPPVEVIMLIDTLNLPFQQIAFVRAEIDQFLRQNGGKLRQPVSIILLSDKGIKVQPRPSTDGNALAEIAKQIKGNISTINPAMGGEGFVERFQLSVKEMANIAENESRKPGRKLVIWVGPGWPLLDRPRDGYSERSQKGYFDGIVELSTRLREARITVDSVSPTNSGATTNLLYRNFLKGVASFREAESGHLALKVLATATGGQILGPDNDVANQINRCIDDANDFYELTFDPPRAAHADEYHQLGVVVNKPGLNVQTITRYYNQPPGN